MSAQESGRTERRCFPQFPVTLYDRRNADEGSHIASTHCSAIRYAT
jgi:hypothetical protein